MRKRIVVAALAIYGAFTALGDGSAYSEPVMAWQTYCAIAMEATNGQITRLTFDRLPPAAPRLRSGYGFLSSDGEIVLRDLATRRQFSLSGMPSPGACPPFRARGYTFHQRFGRVHACTRRSCKGIAIEAGTWPYVFAEAESGVIAITNYGDALLFRDGYWCRMARSADDVYTCDPRQAQVSEPRKAQFYSSIRYHGRTLLGEWPTGRLYEFDGFTLRPSDLTPPPFLEGKPVGYEAQSMAIYCGDLFVGYWPRGELWRHDRRLGVWTRVARLFSAPRDNDADFIPYSSRPQDGLDNSFFGQRITALVPHDGYLYATTSNLGGWKPEIDTFLPTHLEEEYGAVYRIGGCSPQDAR